MNKNYLKLFLTALIALPFLMYGFVNNFIPTASVGTSIICFLLWLVACVATIGLTIDLEPKPISSPIKTLQTTVIILAIVLLVPFRGYINFYNSVVTTESNYEQKLQERPGFYDAMWKTYSQKMELKNLSEATFIKVAETIMNARKDGEHLSWKWVQENSQIPFSEFTVFYKDLSQFIETKREGYFNLEKECQKLARNYNILLDTFPHNIYNKILGRDPIQYHYGFTSDSTITVFSTGKE